MAHPLVSGERTDDDHGALTRSSATMVTPGELRSVEFRDALRGYHRGEVDAWREGAAETVEMLERRCLRLEDLLADCRDRHGATNVDADVIQRTLLRAQVLADETVTDAESRAESLIGGAEAQALALVTEAERTARLLAETERGRLEAELADLGAARASLSADVDALERFAADYRDRIRGLIEAELDRIGVHLREVGAGTGSSVDTGAPGPDSVPAPGAASSGARELSWPTAVVSVMSAGPAARDAR